jgi:hypothetical protein
MENKIVEAKKEESKLRDLLDEMIELSQGRSDYALRHFVVGQHDLPARQRQQVLVELQGLMFELANITDEIRLTEIDIEIIEAERRSMDNGKMNYLQSLEFEKLGIEIGKKKRSIEQQNILLAGRLQECETLYAILQEIPKADKNALEAQEEEYWYRRLNRQFLLGQRDVGGNLNALLETLTEPGKEKPLIEGIESGAVLLAIGLTREETKKLNGGNK